MFAVSCLSDQGTRSLRPQPTLPKVFQSFFEYYRWALIQLLTLNPPVHTRLDAATNVYWARDGFQTVYNIQTPGMEEATICSLLIPYFELLTGVRYLFELNACEFMKCWDLPAVQYQIQSATEPYKALPDTCYWNCWRLNVDFEQGDRGTIMYLNVNCKCFVMKCNDSCFWNF